MFGKATITLGIGPHSSTLRISTRGFKQAIHFPKPKTLECGPMPNVMAALPNTGGALCSTPLQKYGRLNVVKYPHPAKFELS